MGSEGSGKDLVVTQISVGDKPLKVSLGPENPFRLNERRRTTMPFKFSDVNVEIGGLLASSPLVFYRTADDDIEESVAFDLLDDDDQWIRTTDITCSGAIGGLDLAALKHIFSYKRPVNDAIQKLARIQRWILNNPNLLERTGQVDDVYLRVRRLVITPTKAYCLPPTVELSNRVLRNYKHVSDRF
ncbi:RNA-dependent RNA polymerase [Datura stramonium]|uniref:RNA-dependent RNA polymerase n=1 Tax=Datura stramonium TaxID=4076 RepID=A0ABS8RLR7_DATST|nr:RNA-dependent RNA polymerase [Datura stramonium]